MKLKRLLLIGILVIAMPILFSCEKSVTSPDVEPVQPPTASINAYPLQGYAPLTVQFDASLSSAVYGNITAYSWQLDEIGEVNNNPNFEYTFSEPGTYSIWLSVCDCHQQTDEAKITITVDEWTSSDPLPNHDKLP